MLVTTTPVWDDELPDGSALPLVGEQLEIGELGRFVVRSRIWSFSDAPNRRTGPSFVPSRIGVALHLQPYEEAFRRGDPLEVIGEGLRRSKATGHREPT